MDKKNWTGCGDSTPSSKPESDPRKQPYDRGGKGVDWHGEGDGRPASKPSGNPK